MLFRTHLVFGFLIALLFIKLFDINNQILSVILILFFSVFPDIDRQRSKIGKKFKFTSKLINFLFGHRGFLHSIFVPLLLFLSLLIIKQDILARAVLIGYSSHLLLDGLTISGIRPLHPIKKKFRGFVKVGSLIEDFLFVAF